MPTAPFEAHLNLVSQNVMTWASWILTAVLLAYTIYLWRTHRTPFYLLVVLATMVGAFGEPLYDEAFSLYFYTRGTANGPSNLYSLFTAFDVPQPVWTHSGYALLYALPAIFILLRIRQGKLTSRAIWAWAAVTLVESCAFEMIGINIGTYTYWAPQVLRIANYPIVIGILEAAQVVLFAIAASHLQARAKSRWSQLGIFVVFPVTFFGANFGAGVAVIVAIHTQGAGQAVVVAATLVSIGLAVALIRLASKFIPTVPNLANAPEESAEQPVELTPAR
jgi:hypothetical protein